MASTDGRSAGHVSSTSAVGVDVPVTVGGDEAPQRVLYPYPIIEHNIDDKCVRKKRWVVRILCSPRFVEGKHRRILPFNWGKSTIDRRGRRFVAPLLRSPIRGKESSSSCLVRRPKHRTQGASIFLLAIPGCNHIHVPSSAEDHRPPGFPALDVRLPVPAITPESRGRLSLPLSSSRSIEIAVRLGEERAGPRGPFVRVAWVWGVTGTQGGGRVRERGREGVEEVPASTVLCFRTTRTWWNTHARGPHRCPPNERETSRASGGRQVTQRDATEQIRPRTQRRRGPVFARKDLVSVS